MPKKPLVGAQIFQVGLTQDDIGFLTQVLAGVQLSGTVEQLEQLTVKVRELQTKLAQAGVPQL